MREPTEGLTERRGRRAGKTSRDREEADGGGRRHVVQNVRGNTGGKDREKEGQEKQETVAKRKREGASTRSRDGGQHRPPGAYSPHQRRV